MAARGSSARSNGGSKAKSDPVYTIVEIGEDAGVLRVVHPGLAAKTQQAALDKVWAERPVGSKKVHLGAFLAGSWRSCEYDAKEVIVPERKNHGPEELEDVFTPGPTPEAERSGSPVS